MADKRISQLVDRGTVANNDVVPIVVSGAVTTNKATISSIQAFMQGNLDLGVTSVGITFGTSGTDINASGSPVTSSGNITINLPTASATNRGALSSADWITFNAKQPAGNYVTLDTAQTITAQKTFTGSGSSDTMIISHGSGSGFGLDVIKAGNNEAIRVTKSSGSGNAMTVIGGNFEAPTIVKTGGTSSQFLKADGSVDSSTYLTTGTAASTYLPLVGGTLTGNLNGTTSIFGSAFASNQTSKIGIGFESGYSIFNSWGADSSTYGGFKFQINSSIGDPFAAIRIDPSGTTFLGNTEVQGTLQSGTAQIESNNDSPLSTSPPTLSVVNGYQFCKLVIGGSNTFPEFYNFFGVIAMENNDNLADTKLRFYLGNKDTATAGHSNDQLVIQGDGNVGIGTASPTNPLHIQSNTLSQLNVTALSGNTNAQINLEPTGTGIALIGPANNVAFAFRTNATERMRITSGGDTEIRSGNILNIYRTDNARALQLYTTINECVIDSWIPTSEPLMIRSNGTLGRITLHTNGEERMRITSGGDVNIGLSSNYNAVNVYLGTATNGSTGQGGQAFYGGPQASQDTGHESGTASGSNYHRFILNGSVIGSITQLGVSAVLYNTSSDYRLKEDLQEIQGIEKIQAIKVYNYKWKADESRMDGVLAHELAEVLPYAVHGEKDEVDEEGNDVMQGVDYSKIVPILIKAIQEQQEQINSLKNQMQ